jgi:hypothetical protein
MRRITLITAAGVVIALAAAGYWHLHRRNALNQRSSALFRSMQVLFTSERQRFATKLRQHGIEGETLLQGDVTSPKWKESELTIQRVVSAYFKPVPILDGRFQYELDPSITPLTPVLSFVEQDELLRISKSVGRVERVNTPGDIELIGTAFVTDNGKIATNCHVIAQLISATGLPALVPGVEVRVDFSEPARHDPSHEFQVESVAGCPTRLGFDVGVLNVTTTSRDNSNGLPPGLPLSSTKYAPQWGTADARVSLIGYPDLQHTDEPLYRELESLAPGQFGKIWTPGIGQGIDNTQGFDILLHNGSSDSGNSGSPIIEMKTFRVVGVHNCCYSSVVSDPPAQFRLPCSFVFGQASFNAGIGSWELKGDPVIRALVPKTEGTLPSAER